MKRAPAIAVAFMLATSASLLTLTSPGSAHDWSASLSDRAGDSSLRDILAERVGNRAGLRDRILDRLEERAALRDALMDRLERRQALREAILDRLAERGEFDEYTPERVTDRESLRDILGGGFENRFGGGVENREALRDEIRGLIVNRLERRAALRDELMDRLEQRQALREAILNRLENRGELRDSPGTHEQRDQSEYESISCGQRRGASTGPAGDEELLLKQQRLGNDGADTAGSCELGQSDSQLHREKKQVTHRRRSLPGTPVSTRLLVYGASSYDLPNRTPHVASSFCGPTIVRTQHFSGRATSGARQNQSKAD